MKTQYLKINPYQPEREKVKHVVEVLRDGGLVVLPTETVYGIAFDPDLKGAWEKIDQIKRGRKKPYSLNLPNLDWLKRYQVDEYSMQCLDKIRDLLPGPITFILAVRDMGKVGFRIPDNLITQEVILAFSKPIYLPSANLSNEPPARNAQEAMDSLWGKVDLIVDGGGCKFCIPSLVLDLTENPVKILREGPPFVTEEVRRRFNL